MPANRFPSLRSLLIPSLACAAWTAFSLARTADGKTAAPGPALHDGLTAWESVYSVLVHPRCLNCHTATAHPEQGDDRHRHFANVVRGPEGKGVPGLNCVSCHQQANADSTGVPGAHNWHLAPLSMRWQDRNDKPLSSGAVCASVKKQGVDLLKHHQEEPLVLWAWNPGRRPDGTIRASPPLTHAEFVEATRRWVDAGGPCPKEGRR